jgi:putative hemolysin
MKELKGAGAKTQAVWTATCTAMVESQLHRWTSPAVPTSKNYPNDGPSPYGANLDSVGIYQQRANWGDVKSRMDTALSTINFIKTGPSALLKIPNWRNLRPGVLAQSIQVSKYPQRYQAYENLARVLLAQYQAQAVVSASLDGWSPGKPIKTKSARDFVNIALTQVNKAYVFGAGFPNGIQNPEPSYDCSSLVEWAAFQVGITMPRIAQDQYNYCVSKGGSIQVSRALQTRGALLYHTPGDGNVDNISHTGISLGDGRTVEAYDTGIGVIIGGRGSKYASEHWEFAGLMPGAGY